MVVLGFVKIIKLQPRRCFKSETYYLKLVIRFGYIFIIISETPNPYNLIGPGTI